MMAKRMAGRATYHLERPDGRSLCGRVDLSKAGYFLEGATLEDLDRRAGRPVYRTWDLWGARTHVCGTCARIERARR